MNTELFKPEVNKTVVEICAAAFASLQSMDLHSQIHTINEIKLALHAVSPLKSEPVDCVIWVANDEVFANDYNPNSVAPPEMKLLEVSILEDGYTQPIVSFLGEEHREVVDGFHRSGVGKESETVKKRIHGYLPVVTINNERSDKGDRIAATIRHNRARGKHKVEAMSDIVVELKRRNWSDEKISTQLGMDQDEVLRLCQITGLADLFSDQEFSRSWDVEGHVSEDDFKEITDDVESFGDEVNGFRTVNTGDDDRVFHTYEHWECYKAGFYNPTKEGMKKDECELAYRNFLSDLPKFESALNSVISEWKNSCEHYLTNSSMNRIAWLGQAAACYALGIPSSYRGGFSLLTEKEQELANQLALIYLNKWLSANGREEVSMDEAYSVRQADIY